MLDGVRDLRLPLTAGYLTLLTLWILFAEDTIDDPAEGTLLWRFGELFDELGPAAKLGLVSLAAVFVGGILINSVFRPLIDRYYEFSGLDWTMYVEAEWAAASVAVGDQNRVIAERAADGARKRERELAEYEFRICIAMFSPLPVVAVIIEGEGSLVAAFVVVFIVVVVSAVQVTKSAHDYLVVARYELAQERVRDLRGIVKDGHAARDHYESLAPNVNVERANAPQADRWFDGTPATAGDRLREVVHRVAAASKDLYDAQFEEEHFLNEGRRRGLFPPARLVSDGDP